MFHGHGHGGKQSSQQLMYEGLHVYQCVGFKIYLDILTSSGSPKYQNQRRKKYVYKMF